ncbi:hypothetical protein Tco_0643544 [Tanacetum coccineum]
MSIPSLRPCMCASAALLECGGDVYPYQAYDRILVTTEELSELVIMEYLVKVSKRRAFWILNEDILKITILTTNTPYPSRKIRRIRACTHQRPQRKEDQYAVSKRSQYAILKIKYVNILEDIKRGPYSKKLQYAVSNSLDTSYRDRLQTV